jgi:hypothetical protein
MHNQVAVPSQGRRQRSVAAAQHGNDTAMQTGAVHHIVNRSLQRRAVAAFGTRCEAMKIVALAATGVV